LIGLDLREFDALGVRELLSNGVLTGSISASGRAGGSKYDDKSGGQQDSEPDPAAPIALPRVISGSDGGGDDGPGEPCVPFGG
jgi:hypothetical protein